MTLRRVRGIDEGRPLRYGVRRLVGAFTLADLSASKGAFSAQLLAKRGRFGEFDADKSPRKSGDESPHSKIASGK